MLPRDQPILDVGCGDGYYLKELSDAGFTCCGVEGTPNIQEIALFGGIETADLTQPLAIDWPQSTVLCLEVAEHLPVESEQTLIDSIDRYCSGILVLSWAVPGQRGHGHVNCRANSYVYGTFAKRGFELMPAVTFACREAVADDVKYFRNTLLAFRRVSG